MTMIRLTVTQTVEYEPDPKWYYEGATPEQMVAYDRVSIETGEIHMSDFSDVDTTVTAELVGDAAACKCPVPCDTCLQETE